MVEAITMGIYCSASHCCFMILYIIPPPPPSSPELPHYAWLLCCLTPGLGTAREKERERGQGGEILLSWLRDKSDQLFIHICEVAPQLINQTAM
jgi:hypothetical protein